MTLAAIIYWENYYAPLWLFFLISPLDNILTVGDNLNLSAKSQVAFANDMRFVIPLYTYVFAETITWIWFLLAMSDQVNVEKHWWLVKPNTTSDYIAFVSTMGFFGALNAVVGHELFHKREKLSQLLGQWPYTKIMYSHFFDEHLKGHHRTVATM